MLLPGKQVRAAHEDCGSDWLHATLCGLDVAQQ